MAGRFPRSGRIEHAVASGEFIKWDWPNSRLIIDAPAVKVYVGKTGEPFRFSDGITFGNVSTPWVAFCLESADGKPLTGPNATKRILMGAVFDAKNTGFQFNYDVIGGPMEQAKAVRAVGHAPAVVDKVEYNVWFPQKLTGTLKSYDFALRPIQSTAISDGNEIAQRGSTPYLNELSVDSWGGSADLPLAQATAIDTSNPAPIASTGTSTGVGNLLSPIPGLDWSMKYAEDAS